MTYRGDGDDWEEYSEYRGDIVIPSSVTYEGKKYPVTSIAQNAFRDNYYLTSVTIPESVTSILENAFMDCRNLKSINIPKSLTVIQRKAFLNCWGLRGAINIPKGVTSIGEYAFASCHFLEIVNLQRSYIRKAAFKGCISLKEVTGSVFSIGESAFDGCTSLTSITTQGVTKIGEYAFMGCSSLTSITIPEGVTSVSAYTFSDCSSLTSITIPGSVSIIFREAYKNCFGLRDVYYHATKLPETYGYPLFSNTPIGSATLHVPAVALDAYRKKAPWSGFGTIVALTDEDGVADTWQAKQKVVPATSYSISGQHNGQQQRGVNIVRMSDGTTRKVMVK